MIREGFFGRQATLGILKKRAMGLKECYRQNIAVIGDESLGKTALIFKFLDELCDNRIIPVYIEVRPEALVSFVKRFIGVLLYNFLSNSGIPMQEDLSFLIKRSEKYIPKTVERIEQVLSSAGKRKTAGIFTELLLLCESVNQETGKFCVVIFDEFLNLEKLGFKSLYRDWSKLLVTQKATMQIIVSSMKFRAKAVLSNDLSLLFGNFEVIEIEPFDIKTSEQYLEHKWRLFSSDHPGAQSGRLEGPVLNRGLRDFIVHFTGGYPFYLEVMANAFLKPGLIDAEGVLEDLLFDSSGILHQRFSHYIKRFLYSNHSHDYLSVLYLVSEGRNKIKEISHILRKSSKELMARVTQLMELDTITRSGDFLKINDRVFAFWLRFVYQERLRSLTFDAVNQKGKFRENIKGMMKDFYLNAQKPLAERMFEVLRLFEDELVQMERKKFRLSHFRELKALEFNRRNLKEGIIGRSQDSLWIMALKQGLLTEEDIADFAKECKKYRHKLQRKIIVTLQDEIDPNTRLRAMEEKIWAWDINSLNQIFDLFSKPWVIA